ncbi:hypothetical protein EBR21_05845 [bacterium]|nr:hypothetical protein [bacterium]
MASLPVSAAALGILAGDWNCQDTFLWGLRLGAVGFGYRAWAPLMTGRLGLRFPFPTAGSLPPEGTQAGQKWGTSSRWLAEGTIQYVLLPDQAFASLPQLSTASRFTHPSIQQWNVVADTNMTFEVGKQSENPNSPVSGWGVRLWQTLPKSWRTVGALNSTRNAELNGITLVAHIGSERWRGVLGIGAMTAAVDQIAVTFFYPTIELSYTPFEDSKISP